MSKINFSPEAFGFSDPNFRETKLVRMSAPYGESNCKTLLVGALDTGQANAILSVSLELRNRGWRVYGLVRGRADEIFKGAGFRVSRSTSPLTRVQKIGADALITGQSSVPHFDATLNALGDLWNIPTFAVEDYPGSYIDSMGETFEISPQAVPDILFVMDERAKEAEMTKMGEDSFLSSDRVLALGQPALDSIARVDRTKIWEEVREKLAVPKNVKLITWFGQNGGGTVESLKVVLSGLKDLDLDDWMLAVRFHPEDKENIESGVYERLLSPFSRRLIYATRDIEKNPNRVIAASDVLFQERSTTALQAAAWQVCVGSVVVPAILREYPAMMGLWVPVIEDRTSPLITNLEDMRNVLIGVLKDEEYRRVLQRRMQYYKQDGLAAWRIANIIEQTHTRCGLALRV